MILPPRSCDFPPCGVGSPQIKEMEKERKLQRLLIPTVTGRTTSVTFIVTFTTNRQWLTMACVAFWGNSIARRWSLARGKSTAKNNNNPSVEQKAKLPFPPVSGPHQTPRPANPGSRQGIEGSAAARLAEIESCACTCRTGSPPKQGKGPDS